MNSKHVLAAAAVLAGLAASGSASAVSPVSYIFDQPTSCGSWCYHDPNFTKLTDGVVGNTGWAVNQGQEWDGWVFKPVVNIDFKFAGATAIQSVSIGSTQDSLGDVALASFKVYSSANGTTWTLKGTLTNPPSSANDHSSTDTGTHPFYTLSGLGINDQFVRVEVDANGPWSFVDEVTFAGGGVPEPATWALMLSGVFGLGAVARRRRAATVAV